MYIPFNTGWVVVSEGNMPAKTYSRGHEIVYKNDAWVYVDNGLSLSDNRPCKKCGLIPLPGGEDACIGYLPGAVSACCGHGVSEPIVIYAETCPTTNAVDECHVQI